MNSMNTDTSFCAADSVDRVGRSQGPVTVLVRWLVLRSWPALGAPRSSVTIVGERQQGQIVISDTAHWAQRGSWTPSHHAGCQGQGTPTRRLANPQHTNSACSQCSVIMDARLPDAFHFHVLWLWSSIPTLNDQRNVSKPHLRAKWNSGKGEYRRKRKMN